MAVLPKVVIRKAWNFWKDPLGTLQNQPHRIRAWFGELYLQRHGVIEILEAFQRLRPEDLHPGDIEDLVLLYKKVLKRKPLLILEFGAGKSTLVLALALHRNGNDGRLISVDANAQWAESVRSALPNYLKKVCEVIHRPLIEDERYGIKGWRHANIPRKAPNFVYLDGPSLTEERRVAFDLLDMEPNFDTVAGLLRSG